MKTTKNVTVTENNNGSYVVRNNYEEVKTYPSFSDAIKTAVAIAKAEKKGIKTKSLYFNYNVSADKMDIFTEKTIAPLLREK